MDRPADTVERIYPEAVKLMKSLLRKDVPVRLIGVHTGNLEIEDGVQQMSLYDRIPRNDRKLAAAMDDIVQRFGGNAIKRAALVPSKKPHNTDKLGH